MTREDYMRYNLSREDNSLTRDSITAEKNIFIKLKKYIIYLRRNNSPSIFTDYKNFLYKNMDIFTKELGLRELSSQVDTFLDYGDSLEKTIAIGISNYLFQEKMFLTLGAVFNLNSKRDKWSNNGIVPDFNSIRLRYDDAPITFLHRVSNIYSKSKLLNKIWIRILNILIKDPKSSLYLVFNNMSESMKEDYNSLLTELTTVGSLNSSSLTKVDSIKRKSYYLDRNKVLYIVCCGSPKGYKKDGTTIYRCLNFIEGLNSKNEISADIKHLEEISYDDCTNYSYYIFQRPQYNSKLVSVLKKLETEEKTYIAEYDDLIFDLENIKYTPAYNNIAYRKGYLNLTHNRQKALNLFNRYIVSTSPLSKRIKELNPRCDILVLPNCVPRTWLEKARIPYKKQKDNFRYLGYFSGSPTHDKDFSIILKPLKKIMAEFSDIKLLAVGPVDVSGIDPLRVIKMDRVPYTDMIYLIKKCSLTLAPLERNIFTECKSSVKFIEAITSGVPCLATPIHDMSLHKNIGCVTCKEEEWFSTLTKCLTDPTEIPKYLKKYEKNKDKLEVYYHLDNLINFLKKKRVPNEKIYKAIGKEDSNTFSNKGNYPFYSQEVGDSIVGEIFGNKKIKQVFKSTQDNLQRIDIKVATYMRTNKGTLRISLYENNRYLNINQDFLMGDLEDNSWLSLIFDPITNSNKKEYILCIQSINSTAGSSVTCYFNSQENFGKMYINNTLFRGSLNIKLFSS